MHKYSKKEHTVKLIEPFYKNGLGKKPRCSCLSRMHFALWWGKVRTLALVETGATNSVMHTHHCRRLRKMMTSLSGLSLWTANMQHIQSLGACIARGVIQDELYEMFL